MPRDILQLVNTHKFAVYEAVRTCGPCDYEVIERVVTAKGKRTVLNALRELRESGHIHISGWEWTETFQFCRAQYSFGPGVEPPKPKRTREEKQMTQRKGAWNRRHKQMFDWTKTNSVFNIGDI